MDGEEEVKAHSESEGVGCTTGGKRRGVVFGGGSAGGAADFALWWLLGVGFLNKALSGDRLLPATHPSILCWLTPLS